MSVDDSADDMPGSRVTRERRRWRVYFAPYATIATGDQLEQRQLRRWDLPVLVRHATLRRAILSDSKSCEKYLRGAYFVFCSDLVRFWATLPSATASSRRVSGQSGQRCRTPTSPTGSMRLLHNRCATRRGLTAHLGLIWFCKPWGYLHVRWRRAAISPRGPTKTVKSCVDQPFRGGGVRAVSCPHDG